MKQRRFRAPGRVNLIGEHTDYNDGFVLPAAIDLECEVRLTPWDDGRLCIRSRELEQESCWRTEELDSVRPQGDWSDYVVGVAQQLARRGVPIPSADVEIESAVPLGAGLSSSAALEVAVGLALTVVGEHPLEGEELARACQQAEVEFVGMQCGIMDQFAAVFGLAGHALLLDCRSLERRPIALPEGLELLLVDTGVKHHLAASAYNERRRECERAAELLTRPLRDIPVEEWDEIEDEIPEPYRSRARHVIHENQRTLDFAAACERGDTERLGELMQASHQSLALDYKVSCEELDFLAAQAAVIEGVVGARMTGGGFGGCTVNLVWEDAADDFQTAIRAAYKLRYDREPKIYVAHPSAGAREIVD